MNVTIPIELEFEIEFNVIKEEPRTWDYPGHPAEVEICAIKYNGHTIPDDMADEIIKDNEDDIIDCCWGEVKEIETDRAVSRMEDRYERFERT